MSISIHRLTIPVFQRGFGTLKTYLDKAEAFAEEKKIDPTILVNARLAPDMLSFAGQYQRAADGAKFTLARLTSTEAPKFEDNETTIADLRERLAKTENYITSFSPEALEGTESREIMLPGNFKVAVSGGDYVTMFALPNLYFHITTAHAILRSQGAPVGKLDYLGPFSK